MRGPYEPPRAVQRESDYSQLTDFLQVSPVVDLGQTQTVSRQLAVTPVKQQKLPRTESSMETEVIKDITILLLNCCWERGCGGVSLSAVDQRAR